MLDISIVVPLYNEEENIELLCSKIKEVLSEMNLAYQIIMVDDGSKDGSFEIIEKIAEQDSRIRGISFSRNFGHQYALLAGIRESSGKYVVMMDGDLQHPPSLIKELYTTIEQGYDIVHTVRADGDGVPFFKKLSSRLYYAILNMLTDLKIVPGSADFRIVSRRTADIIGELPEKEKFLRALFYWIGFKSTTINYQVQSRHKGSSKYSLGKMTKFALSGVVAFSTKPLRLAVYFGFITSFVAFVYALYASYKYFQGVTISGWTSLLLTILFIGGVQLISLGIIGEYLGRLYSEVKNRPSYLIDRDTERKETKMN